MESRPYMRARAGLADALWAQGEHEAALGHYEELLRLNPGDNQGVRRVLANRLVERGDDRRLERLLDNYPEDGSATILFTRALLAFRQKGPGKEANARLQEACQWNPHVPAYLLGRRPLPEVAPEYIGMGDESEAAVYAGDSLVGWAATPGALQWLASRT